MSDHPKIRGGSALKFGLVALSSAIAGGLAAAWWHRRTITKLQNPILSMDIQVAESREELEEAMEFREF